MLLGDAVEPAREHVLFTRHRGPQDQPLAVVNEVAEILGCGDETCVERFEPRLIRAVDENTIEVVQKLIAGRAVNWPVRTQRFFSSKDLLDQYVKRQ